jgi:hypothetical protein
MSPSPSHLSCWPKHRSCENEASDGTQATQGRTKDKHKSRDKAARAKEHSDIDIRHKTSATLLRPNTT